MNKAMHIPAQEASTSSSGARPARGMATTDAIWKLPSYTSFRRNSTLSGGTPERTRETQVLPKTLILAAFIFLSIFNALADDISVSAALSATSTTVDQPVNLTVTVTGGMSAEVPTDVQANGLDIEYRGQSRRIEMMNFRGSMSIVNTFLVSPQKPGKFTIPAITIDAGGKTWRTDPLTLEVTKGSGGSGSDSGDQNSTTPKVYAELIIPKDTAYVGEVIPAEVRYYFASDVQFQVNPPGQVPQIAGEGFSKQRYPQPRVEQTDVKGEPYRVLIYKTALIAAKAGDLEVGPAELIFVVSMPQAGNRRRSSIFNDPFADDFFNNPLIAQRIEREMTVRSDPLKLKIMPLPPGKPTGFAGAVGQFTLKATAEPATVKMGDPVTVRAVISGRGNFDLVNAPTLASTEGWRTYPATGRVESQDDLGVAGDKNFDMAIIPEGAVKEVPPLNFSYFDPAQGKYVTLSSSPIPIRVEGKPSEKPKSNDTLTQSPTPDSVTAATPTPKADDLAPLITNWRAKPQSFQPLWERHEFWLAQSLPLLLLLGLVGQKIAARFQPDSAALQRKRWDAEARNLRPKLQSSAAADYFLALARLLEIDALKTGQIKGSIPSNADILDALQLSEDERGIAGEIFARRDELAYGGGRGGREISPEEHRRYEALLAPGAAR